MDNNETGKKQKKRAYWLLFASILLLVVSICIVVYPSIYARQCKTRVYSDIDAKAETVESANLRVVGVKEEFEENVTTTAYSAGASGVIFRRDGDVYYALTAYHVVKNNSYTLIGTVNTPTYSEYRKEGNKSQYSYYSNFPEAKTEYLSEEADLAIISFKCEEDLAVAQLSASDPSKGTRILVIGNPDNAEKQYFLRNYGVITNAEYTTFATNDGQLPSLVFKHNAYESHGSSGSGVYDENLNLVGINIGGGTDAFNRFKYGVMTPIEQILKCIDEWEKR